MSKQPQWANDVWRSNGLLKKALIEKLNGFALNSAEQTESRMI